MGGPSQSYPLFITSLSSIQAPTECLVNELEAKSALSAKNIECKNIYILVYKSFNYHDHDFIAPTSPASLCFSVFTLLVLVHIILSIPKSMR